MNIQKLNTPDCLQFGHVYLVTSPKLVVNMDDQYLADNHVDSYRGGWLEST